MYTIQNISTKQLILPGVGTIAAGHRKKVHNLHEPNISAAIQAGFIKVVGDDTSIEDALSLFVTVDDALFFEKGVRLLDCDPADILQLSALDPHKIAPSFWGVIEDLSDCWEFIFSTPEELVNDDGTIRVPSKYERFLDDYNGF